jgi:DNA polymerase elongation subunit (family B)
MLPHINIYNLIFIDIETVPTRRAFSELSPPMQELWSAKHTTLRVIDEAPEEGYLKRAGIYAEFAKVICICMGFLHFDRDRNQKILRLKSFYGDDEKQLLEKFCAAINKGFTDAERFHFCGHNIREFDIPFLCRRMLINRLVLPDIFDISGKRPWEMQDVDTLQLWKFGDYKSYTSLKLLAEIFGLPTPKDNIEGKDVCRIYWQEKNLKRIVEYCGKDVVTVARLLFRFKGEPDTLEDNQVTTVP